MDYQYQPKWLYQCILKWNKTQSSVFMHFEAWWRTVPVS